MPLQMTRVDKMMDSMMARHIACVTYVESKTSEDDGAAELARKGKQLAEGSRRREGRLSEVVGGWRRAGASRVQP